VAPPRHVWEWGSGTGDGPDVRQLVAGPGAVDLGAARIGNHRCWRRAWVPPTLVVFRFEMELNRSCPLRLWEGAVAAVDSGIFVRYVDVDEVRGELTGRFSS